MTIFQRSWPLVVRTRGNPDVEFEDARHRLPAADLPEWLTQGTPLELRVTIEAQHTFVEWARAYAGQGVADLRVYRELSRLRMAGAIDDCHEMHYLQMAAEKIARAYMLKYARLERFLDSHVVVNEFVQRYGRSLEWRLRFRDNAPLWAQVRQLAGAIEDLAPAVERQLRPMNAEYPWSDGRRLTVPKDVQFRQRFQFPQNVWTALIEMLDEIGADVSR